MPDPQAAEHAVGRGEIPSGETTCRASIDQHPGGTT